MLTTPLAVRGSEHWGSNLNELPLALCYMTTMTLDPQATRSMAPPMPFTSFLGMIQLAISQVSLTCMAPSMVRSRWPPLMTAKDCAEEKIDAPGRRVMVSYHKRICTLPALMLSASS